MKVHPVFLLQVVKNLLCARSSRVNRPQTFSVESLDFQCGVIKIHRLDLGPLLTGIALSSLRMHKYSPITAISAMQATLTSHQDRAPGKWAL